MFLNISLIVLAIISIIGGDFTMFIVLLSLSYILAHTALVRAARSVMYFINELDSRRPDSSDE